MDWKKEWKALVLIVAGFLVLFYLPLGRGRFNDAVIGSLELLKWYAREHVILCIIPALFIAGAISVFVSQAAVIKYLGPKANKVLAYGVGSASGGILAVCSCTVLPLFAGIWKNGAGLGPAIAFLYSGPAINVLAVILTARILGLQIGVARGVGAILFSIVIGLLMHLLFRREEQERAEAQMSLPEPEVKRPLWQNILYFAAMVAILVFANWGESGAESGFWYRIYSVKWIITSASALLFGVILILWFGMKWWKMVLAGAAVIALAILFPTHPIIPFAGGAAALGIFTSTQKGEMENWFSATWGLTKQIMPLLLIGILISGLLLGKPGGQGIIPPDWIGKSVGGNSFLANFSASVVGAFMYFATLTEVPIVQGLLGSGMGKGPALALLLAGPSLSLPSMLVIRSILGTKKTIAYVSLVIVMATLTGIFFGAFFK